MTLIARAHGLEELAEYVRSHVWQLYTQVVSAKLDEQYAYIESLFNAYLEPAEMLVLMNYRFVLPTYSPFVPYTGLSNMSLNYWVPLKKEHWLGISLSMLSRRSSLNLNSLATDLSRLDIVLGLQDKYLNIDETTRPGRVNVALFRLLPQLLL